MDFLMLKTSLPLVLEQKIVLTGYRKSYPRNHKCDHNRSNGGRLLILDLKCLTTSRYTSAVTLTANTEIAVYYK
jgi:hypothetical protein